ncbi:hypothetical protein VOLCADRAFT_103631 [Volvox carteri f. nagariensis]|uniref:Uncharacterized protein n=1 Tax=Volvox carteri f. nagariensis TaxID=3068 RepID=D8TNI2_VOLCA|nr:uncharacterized protein VOLCADRAFT_103631 [Volvox carteri f. nagariensis]EFJ50844.1 hypothetical protein VOLCADRAFT_103631 [Volvox carteri f. nagariensis]|eukprot:XP_002947856.1 hypothetical protein VOLCADRAFT_103631 [Volvox carteri f. nagariensis]
MVADKATASALSGDPRRPESVTPYKPPPPSEDKVDAYATVGMVLAMLGMLLKLRIFSFISIAFIASSFIQRNAETDVKQLIMVGMMAVAGLFFSHLQVLPSAPSATNTTGPAVASGAGSEGP